MANQPKEQLVYTLVSADRGLLTVIHPTSGYVLSFIQHGINNMPQEKRESLIRKGKLHPEILRYPELPTGSRVFIECEPSIFNVRTKWYPTRFKAVI